MDNGKILVCNEPEHVKIMQFIFRKWKDHFFVAIWLTAIFLSNSTVENSFYC